MDLRRVGGYASAVLVCAALFACGDGDSGVVTVGYMPREGGAPSVTPLGDAGMDGGNADLDAAVDAGSERGPLVNIVGPLASSDPLLGPVLTGATVEVSCEVRQRPGEAAVDPGKIKVNLYAGGDSVPLVKDIPALAQGDDLYKATIPLDVVPTGRVRFACSATDAAATNPQQSSAIVETFYDAGPLITFTNLNEMSVVARGSDTKTDLTIQFQVAAAPLAAGDTAAEVAEVKLLINEREVALDPPGVDGYAKPLDIATFFESAPIDSFTIAVTARNGRAGAVVVKKQLIVRVDGEGPKIVVKSPARDSIVGGTVKVEMDITDALAGIALGAERLFALILYDKDGQDETKHYTISATDTQNVYGFTFEASAFSNTRDIVAQIHAFDKVGNESLATLPMRLDTMPPYVDLVPPDFIDVSGTNPVLCSAPYAPIGASPRDGEVVLQLARFRALVWERAIRLSGATEVFFSGVRGESVRFYAQDDPTVPLLIDTNSDGVCDAINDSQVLGDRAPFATPFDPVAPGGSLPAPGTDYPPFCSAAPPPSTPPPARCDGSEMAYVTKHTASSTTPIPVVYARAVTASGVGCTGVSFDMSGHAGWSCVAAAARDNTGGQGNLGVSKPIRVCRKLQDGDCEGKFAGELLEPPETLTCTDGCTLPALWTEFDPRERVVR